MYFSIKQDSWEDEEEEGKEDDGVDEATVVPKTKPKKSLEKRIAEREVSFSINGEKLRKILRICFHSAIETGRTGG